MRKNPWEACQEVHSIQLLMTSLKMTLKSPVLLEFLLWWSSSSALFSCYLAWPLPSAWATRLATRARRLPMSSAPSSPSGSSYRTAPAAAAGVMTGSGRVSTGSVAEITRHDSATNAEVGQMNVRPIPSGINQVSPLATCWSAFACKNKWKHNNEINVRLIACGINKMSPLSIIWSALACNYKW